MNYAFPMVSILKIVDQVERYFPLNERICVRRSSTFLIYLSRSELLSYQYTILEIIL